MFSLLLGFLNFSIAASMAYEQVIVVDAGSSGTRAFFFEMLGNPRSKHDDSGIGEHEGTVNYIKLGSSSGGAHTYPTGGAAADAILPSISKVLKKFKREGQVDRVYIRGTGGLRSASNSVSILNGMKSAFEKSFPGAVVEASTISGDEEAWFALLAANFLVGALDPHSMRVDPDHAVGIMDMGGQSMQFGLLFDPLAYSKSRKAALEAAVANETAVEPTPGVSVHYDAAKAKAGASPGSLGFGSNVMLPTSAAQMVSLDGFGMQAAFDKVSALDSNNDCQFGNEQAEVMVCAGLIASQLTGTPTFTSAIAGFTPFPTMGEIVTAGAPPAVISFAKFLLEGRRSMNDLSLGGEWPKVAWSNIRDASGALCRAPPEVMVNVTSTQSKEMGHPLTSDSELPNRCFGLLYIYRIMEALGFHEESRQLDFYFDMGGMGADWPLGAFIVDFHQRNVASTAARRRAEEF